ncbi:hypothetical protein BH20ACT5_BH20ACT5_05210 [soil metagenome]
MLALLSMRLRTLIIGAVLVRAAPLVARLLRSAGEELRRRGGDTLISRGLIKAADGLSWFVRRRTKSANNKHAKHGLD